MQPEQIKEILDKNSDRMLMRITATETIEIKDAITAFVSEIEESDLEIKQSLLDFKFGQNHQERRFFKRFYLPRECCLPASRSLASIMLAQKPLSPRLFKICADWIK